MAEELYGRKLDRQEIIDSEYSVSIVAGDSGIGKSRLLQSLTSGWRGPSLVASPVVLAGVTGSLQAAIASALSDCLHQYTTKHPDAAVDVWEAVKEIAGRAGSVTHRQVGEIFMGRVVEYVEAKIGKDATKVARSVLGEVLKPTSETFDDRLARIAAPDLASELARLAMEIASHTSHHVIIRLDSGERLSRDDGALLAELAGALDSSVRLVVCVNSFQAEGAEIVRILEARDVPCHRVEALAEVAVFSWLSDAEVPRGQWDMIVQLSSGYPLFIDSAIRLLRDGGSLSDLRSPRSFEALLRASWNRLDPSLQLIATKLAGFVDPPSDEYLENFLNLQPLELSTLRRHLLDRGVWVRRADGIEWFHERRRAYLWRDVLSDKDRRIISAAVVSSFGQWLEKSGVIDSWIVSSLPVVSREVEAATRDEYLGKVLELSHDELAILWALIEVVEPDGKRGIFADTGEVVRYAYQRAGNLSDPIAAIERLVELELVVISSNEYASVTGLVPPNSLRYAALVGEVARRFQVRPVPRLASSAFHTFIKRHIEPFGIASISLGEGSIVAHLEVLRDLLKSGGRRMHERVPSLGIHVAVDEHPITVTATFNTSDHRDRARRNLLNEFGVNSRVSLKKILDLPPSRVKSGWYGSLLAKTPLDKKTETISRSQDLVAHLERRLTAVAAIRSHLTDDEAAILGVDHNERFLLFAADVREGWVEYEVTRATSSGVIEISFENDQPLVQDPLVELRLRAAGLLEPQERLNRWTIRYGVDGEVLHPLLEVRDRLIQRARKFNRGLPEVQVALNEESLFEKLRDQWSAKRSLEESLFANGLVDRPPLTNTSLYVFLYRVENGWGQWMATAYDVADGRNSVVVRRISAAAGLQSFRPSVDQINLLGIADIETIRAIVNGFASSILAQLLGYEHGDIRLVD
ncbi:MULTISPECIES: hypothetical protein [unclassified Micromonospora]|uniref:hypothetical protein n=1 Tax=unclassified Micromonospora TaxID=2617518 RepID=UPI003A873A2C